MKYYAVTEDPRELYHYGVKGMKWGQHIFGDKPKSPGYHKAVKKLKSLSAKASKATAKSVSTVGQTVKKSAQQMLYNARAAQQKRFEKSVQKAQANLDRTNVKYDNWQEKQVQTAAVKQINKAIHKVKVKKAKQNASNALRTVGQTAAKMPGQISENVRKLQEAQYQKAVKKAQDRNKLSDALRGLDKEEKLIKQVNRDRKMEELREKHVDIMADNDLKTMQKAVRVEKNMPKYYQEARTGQLKYGKLSDEQIGRLQNRLALEANTRRLGSTEAPSWREQKKQARHQGYLQGITKGVSAGMEEVARAGVQYGIRNLANRKKMDAASELKAEREKNANRIKNKKTRSEMREDLKQEAYETQIKSGQAAYKRVNLTATKAGRNITDVKNIQRIRQERIDDAKEERKYLTQQRHNDERDKKAKQEESDKEWKAYLTETGQTDEQARSAYYGTPIKKLNKRGDVDIQRQKIMNDAKMNAVQQFLKTNKGQQLTGKGTNTKLTYQEIMMLRRLGLIEGGGKKK